MEILVASPTFLRRKQMTSDISKLARTFSARVVRQQSPRLTPASKRGYMSTLEEEHVTSSKSHLHLAKQPASSAQLNANPNHLISSSSIHCLNSSTQVVRVDRL